jgi:eukaryotic-like serine/threonine-protein kinase
MDSAAFQRAEQIFHEALERPPVEREAYVREACGGEEPLYELVRDLLGAQPAAEQVFAQEPRLHESALGGSPLIGRRIGPYRLEAVLGEGGSGVVLRGLREGGEFEQRVAVKLVRLAFASEPMVLRFTEERRILARLEHPNIARLLDGGVTEDGTPYLVLEHVEGMPVDQWVRERKADARTSTELMRRICGAVEYMHQNLIVHRDLKPANVLVTSDGEPKLLDFGTARLLESAQLSGATRTAFPMMTLRYASPEQLKGLAGSTRSDVYALGVMLYELLTGRWPYGDEPATVTARISAVLDSEPVRPAAPAGSRRLDADIESILLKAIEKDPAGRYGSAAEFSADLGRYLAGEPVEARAAGSWYRAGKFARRHWAAVAVAAAFVVTLATATVVSVRQARIAERERATMQEIASFTENLLGASQGMTPIANRGRDLKLVEIIDQASESVGPQFKDRPAVEAGLQATLGGSYMALGLYGKAKPHVERAAELALPLHGEAHPLSARVLKLRGRLRLSAGEFEAAGRDLAAGLNASPDSFTYSYLAEAVWRQGRVREARGHLVKAHAGMLEKFGREHTTTATMVNNIGVMDDDLGDYAAAEKQFREAADVLRRQPGPPPLLFYPLMGIQRAHLFRGEFTEAKATAEEALRVALQTGGEKSRSTASGMMAVAVVKAHLEEPDAEPLAREALERTRQAYPLEHIEVARSLCGLGRVLLLRKKWEEAGRVLQESLLIARKRYPGPNWRTAEAKSLAGVALAGQGKHAEAGTLLDEGYREAAAVLPAEHPRVVELRKFLELHNGVTPAR